MPLDSNGLTETKHWDQRWIWRPNFVRIQNWDEQIQPSVKLINYLLVATGTASDIDVYLFTFGLVQKWRDICSTKLNL